MPAAISTALTAPALAPLIASKPISGSSKSRSRTPQVKAPNEPPPCKASESLSGGHFGAGSARPKKAHALSMRVIGGTILWLPLRAGAARRLVPSLYVILGLPRRESASRASALALTLGEGSTERRRRNTSAPDIRLIGLRPPFSPCSYPGWLETRTAEDYHGHGERGAGGAAVGIGVSNQTLLPYISALRYARQPKITPVMNRMGQ